jgi:2-hydroxychromene-2-carboxylate isomerase
MSAVEVFADIGCPFAHVGLRRLVAARAAAGRTAGDAPILVRAWPIEWVNESGWDAAFIAAEVAELRRAAAADLFAGFDETTFPTTTIPALQLGLWGYGADPAVGEAVALHLRDVLFEEGRDPGSADVRDELRARFRLTGAPPGPEAVHADWEEGRSLGVIGSPHFFLRDLDFFCPALDVGHHAGHLRVEADPRRFAQLTDAWLAGP